MIRRAIEESQKEEEVRVARTKTLQEEDLKQT